MTTALLIPWLISALSGLAAALLIVLWHRKAALLQEEVERLRFTLNSWEQQPTLVSVPAPAPDTSGVEERLESLRRSTRQLARQISSKADFQEPEQCVDFFRDAITSLSRANRKHRDELQQSRDELDALQARLRFIERDLEETVDDPSTLDAQLDDVRELLAITIAERDQLRWRVQELTSNMRRG
jgi:chromosome segregation ATPase